MALAGRLPRPTFPESHLGWKDLHVAPPSQRPSPSPPARGWELREGSASPPPLKSKHPLRIIPREAIASLSPSTSSPQKKTRAAWRHWGRLLTPPTPRRTPGPLSSRGVERHRRWGSQPPPRTPTLGALTSRACAWTKAWGGLTHPRGEGGPGAGAPALGGAPRPQAHCAGSELA